MLSVVSKQTTPVLPFIVQGDTIPPSQMLNSLMEEFENARFFAGEPDGELRLTVAVTSAMMAQKSHPEAVIVLAPADLAGKDAGKLTQAMATAVRLARTGKVVSLMDVKDPNAKGHIKHCGAIQGMPDSVHLGAFRDLETDLFTRSGIYVMRADRFLLEAEILCPTHFYLCQDALMHGITCTSSHADDLASLATLSFYDGFWARTDNRAAALMADDGFKSARRKPLGKTVPVHQELAIA